MHGNGSTDLGRGRDNNLADNMSFPGNEPHLYGSGTTDHPMMQHDHTAHRHRVSGAHQHPADLIHATMYIIPSERSDHP